MIAAAIVAAALAGASPGLPECSGPPVEPGPSREQPIQLSWAEANGRQVLRIAGRINPGDTAIVAPMLQDDRIEEIWFDSPGGDFNEALLLGRTLRARGLTTRIPRGARCVGACAEAFLGGIARMIDEGGHIGFTAVPLSDPASSQSAAERENAAARWTERRADYYIRAGISRALLRLQLDVPATQICWLTSAALRRYNVANTALIAP